MAYNEFIADRVRRVLEAHKVKSTEKKMMGGLCFMVDDKMCVGVVKDELMARIGPTEYDALLDREGCRAMDFTGRPMKGYVFVNADGMDRDDDLEFWVRKSLDFNPLAKSSKKKKT